MHHRAAGCWEKLYYPNGHTFQAKRFSRQAHCAVYTDCVGGLGHQVYKCTNCKPSVHKKCHKLVTIECGQHSLSSEPMVPVDPSSMTSDPAHTVITHNLSTHEALEQDDEENEAGNTGESGKASSGLGLEDFDLLQVIGRESYGKVLLVQLKELNPMYAIKAVKKEHFDIHQLELEETIRLSELKKDSELLIHSLPCIPEHPKVPCPGEEKSMHHRAAGCWEKLYYPNGHTFQAKRFSRQAHCAVYTDCVGGLGHQVYKCTNCKPSVHKKCHKLVTTECGQHSLSSEPMVPVDPSSMTSDPAHTVITHNLSTHEALEQDDEENEAGNTGESGKASSGLGLEDFDLLQVIGRESYGKVLLVQLKELNPMYAIKAVKKEHFDIHQVKHVVMKTSAISISHLHDHLNHACDIQARGYSLQEHSSILATQINGTALRPATGKHKAGRATADP
ncbi:Protein kinase C iota type [Heterocephalus glaber]|uniref:non-specific serine/threonine protein kinase n=1 Tax=Heterocephalus glaber TaxID=10181 RepID=G5C3T2_HETGA|nr:Protein kinase C iota type [Heterocephalus glaber]